MITPEMIQNAYTYTEYRNLIDTLLAKNATTGHVQSQEKIDFTKLNVQRMNRIEKTVFIPEAIQTTLANITNQTWLLIGEAWCGDCAQIIPVINKFAEAADGKIIFKIILRDDNEQIMNDNLSGGSKAIPKLLLLNSTTLAVEKTWGSRPKSAHQIMLNWKANENTISKEDFEKELHLWYAKNRGQEIIEEINALI